MGALEVPGMNLATVHRSFESHARRNPGRTALICGGESLTYGELSAQANGLAARLRGLGVGPDGVVAVRLQRSMRFVTAVLAIHKAGAAYLPVDPNLPPERAAFMIRDARAPVMITEGDGALPDGVNGLGIVSFDAPDWDGRSSTPDPEPDAGGSNLAYVLYTSGSTGQPKGVMIEHGSLSNLFFSTRCLLGAPTEAVWLASSNFSFDISIQEFLWPLCHGQTVVIFRGDESGESIPSLINRHGVTHLQGTPSRANLLLAESGAAVALGRLRQLLLAGEALMPDLAARLHDHLRGDLFNLYGPTETTIYSSGCRVPIGCNPVPIGSAMAHTDLIVVDEALQPVPTGETGELLIAGAGLARGYLGRPELTRERFISYSAAAGQRAYRTGDLVRQRPDGQLDYLGRLDHQVKIRGYRIELGEIEMRLREIASVQEAVVLARERSDHSRELVAYLTQQGSSPPRYEEVRSHLKARLPDYCVPAHYVLVAGLPLSPSKKIDRKALAATPGTPIQPAPESGPARDDLEERLTEMWRGVLGIDQVGVHDRFDDVGGHSLLALKLVADIQRDTGVQLPWSAIFAHPTIASLAGAIRAARTPSAPPEPDTLPSVVGDEAPASMAQEQMWMLHEASTDKATYTVGFGYRLAGRLDLPRLEESLARLVERHDMLRTEFIESGGELRQKVVRLPGPSVTVVDLRDPAAPNGSKALEEQARSALAKPFDMRRAPLWRLHAFRVGAEETFLLWTAHHVLVDEQAVLLLFGELATIYSARPGLEPRLAPLKARYAAFAVWERRHLASSAADAHRQFWSHHLENAPEDLVLPTDRPRPLIPTSKGGQVHVAIAPETRLGLERIGREVGASAFVVGLAAYGALLSRLTGQTDLLIGTPVSGRQRDEFQSVVGLFLNPIPIRCPIDRSAGFRRILAAVRRSAMEAFEHSSLPTAEIARLTSRPMRSGGQVLFRTMFVLVNEPALPLPFEGFTTRFVPVHTHTAKFDLSLTVHASRAGGWECFLEYSSDLFDAESAGRILTYWSTALAAFAARPDLPLDEICIAGEAERSRLIAWGTGPDSSDVVTGTLLQRFAAIAHAHASAIAVVDGPIRLTYRELDAQANRLAHLLRDRGVGRGNPVGLHLDRSVGYIVAVLAVIKAGGVYVPLPTEFPLDRIRFMATDAGLRLALTGAGLPPEALPPGVVVLNLDEIRVELKRQPVSAPGTIAAPDDAAYIMYTSGSTGQPKGVVVPHRAVLRLVVGSDYIPWNPEQRILLMAATGFDASTFELWGPLLHGARCVVHGDRFPTVASLQALLRDQQITCALFTTGLFNHLIDQQPDLLSPLHHCLIGGEALSVPHVLRALAAMPTTRLVNAYGPTEAATMATTFAIPGDGSVAVMTNIPIGRPLPSTHCYVLDDRRILCPVGVPGELFIGGSALALGYWNRPELTEAAFVPDPFQTTPGARLYRSGDRVRWRPDGNLEYLGRFDNQVKIRGNRVEPGEVEAALMTHPRVRDAAVVSRRAPGGGSELIAVLVVPQDAQPTISSLREHLRTRLPDPMIPTRWECLPALPLNPNGKLDRRRLELQPAPLLGSPEPEVVPRTGTELALLRIWREVIGRENLTIHDEFFSAGGHSLLAMKLVSMVRREFGVEVSLLDLFSRPTVAMLADWIAAHDRSVRRRSRDALRGQGDAAPLFHIPGFHGFEFLPRSFREAIGRHRPYFDGLQYPGLDGREAPLATISGVAAALVTQLTDIWPEGPFCLSGLSGGGEVALEMAGQLRRAGRDVELVLLYDSWSPLGAVRRTWIGALRAAFRLLKATQRSKRPDLVKAFITNRLLNLRRLLLRLPTPADTAVAAAADESLSPRARVATASFHALGAHQPTPYPGRVVLFKAQDENTDNWIRFGPDPQNGWQPFLTGDFTIRRVPGQHLALFKEPALTSLIKETLIALGHQQ